ncbi:Uncharacterised protein [Escherichia coli]|nr:Uncharacterised protein [Escherichia coli]
MATINARIDDDIKNQADEVLNLMNIFFCIDAFISESFILWVINVTSKLKRIPFILHYNIRVIFSCLLNQLTFSINTFFQSRYKKPQSKIILSY